MRRAPVRLQLLLIAVALAGPASVLAQPAPAGLVTMLRGDAVVFRAPAARPVALRFKDDLFARDRIETRAEALVRMLLRGKVLVTVRELSVFTVAEDLGRATIHLEVGRVAVGVARKELLPGESVEIRTPNAVAAVRGSSLVAEVRRVGGVPESDFIALAATVPITVAPLSNPQAAVGLSVNEAVSVRGLGLDSVLGPVRIITPVQAATAARAAQAPKPQEQTDKPPARLARRVSGDRVREAAQLSETLSRGDGAALGGDDIAFAPLLAELSVMERTYRQTQDLLDLTTLAIDREFEATRAAIDREFEASVFDPEFVISERSILLPPATPLLSFAGVVDRPFSPLVFVLDGQLSQPDFVSLFQLEPGATVGIRSGIINTIRSEVTVGARVLHLEADASLTTGPGALGVLSFSDSTVVTGAELVRLDERARLELEGPLLTTLRATFTAGADQSAIASLVFLGPDSHTSTSTGLSLLTISGGGATATGSLLFVGERATVTSTGGGGFGLVRLSEAVVTTGGGLVTLDTDAAVTLNHPLLTSLGATLETNGTDGGAVVGLGPGARLLASTQLTVMSFGGDSLQTAGSVLAIGEGATLSTLDATLPIVAIQGSEVLAGRDIVSLAAGAALGAHDRPLLFVLDSLTVAQGALLSVDRDAAVDAGGSSVIGFITLANSRVGTGEDLVVLRPSARLELERPLLHTDNSLVQSGRGLLSLGAGASFQTSELIPRALLRVITSTVDAGGDLIGLGTGAELGLNRTLLFTDSSDVRVAGHALSLGDGARMTSGSGALGVGLFEIANSRIEGSQGLVSIGPGATLRLTGPLLFAAGSDLVLLKGFVTTDRGLLAVTGSADALVTLLGGTHSVATQSGAAMFDLTGSVTAVDPGSGLTVGTDRLLVHGGPLLDVEQASLVGQTVVRLDTALLEASAPLLRLREMSAASTAGPALDLSLRARVASLGSLVTLDRSSLMVDGVSLVRLAGGSILRVTGDLIELANASTLTLQGGALLSASGGSVVSVSGAAIAFSGAGGNRVSVANNLCPCSLIGGIPVALRDGALPTNVVIGPNPIKNPSLGTVTLGAGAAAIVVSGATSRVTISAP